MLVVSHHLDLVDLHLDLVVGDVVPHLDHVHPNVKMLSEKYLLMADEYPNNIFLENFKKSDIPKAWFYSSQLKILFLTFTIF